MDIFAIDYILGIIAARASPSDVNTILKTCKFLYQKTEILRQMMTNNYRLFLKSKVWDVDELLDNMIKLGGLATGSSVLQCLYSEVWDTPGETTDIDILFIGDQLSPETCALDTHHLEKGMRGLLFKNGYMPQVVKDDDNLFICRRHRLVVERYGMLPFYTIKFAHPDFKHVINITYIDPKICSFEGQKLISLFDYIDYFFDLNCCKVAFDGFRMYVRDTYGIITKKTTVDMNINKYWNAIRSYPFYMVPHTLPKKVLIKHRLMKRCNKYINRGFEIVNIQELDSLD